MTVDRDELDELRLIRPLAEGGAFLAHDPLLDRAVVVRFLPANGLAEGRALARVAHPHLARIHHVRGGPRPYLVLEYPRGTPLDAAAPCLPTREALNVARALVGAVSTLHEAGLVHGSLRAASVILGDGGPQLLGLDGARPATPDGLAEDTRALGELLRLLGIEPPRVASALELLDELDLRLRPRADLGGNPYRGLRAYETRDHAVFFGRQEEVEVLLRRLGAEPWLVVAGRSGAGKSSLVRAGLLPAIADESLDGRGWDRAIMRPGARPLVDLATCLAPWLARSTEEVEALAQHDPSSLARLAAARGGRGLCLLIDPLDPIMTLGSDGERRAFLAALAPFGTLSPGVRVVMTLRSDFLPALSELGVVGRDLLRATVLCGAMTADGLRQAIVDPARALGFSFET
ncbi:MAG TPA: hypothetical protein VMV01_14100, partial [Planctomycetota bacterium]|nr:hypothetical protein [Planctomycetota bacterium]